MDDLAQLVTEACKYPPGSPQRQRYLTQAIRLTASKLWRENVAYYQDALQQTWEYFCKNICERTTGERYDPARGSVITWLNYYLKRRLQDFYIEQQKQQIRTAGSQRQSARSGEQEGEIDPVDRVAAPADVPPILEAVQTWAEADPSGELCRTHIEGKPEVNCQVLILRRLPPETSWKDLSEELGAAVPTLSSFYQRQCLPRLRKFGESEGYL